MPRLEVFTEAETINLAVLTNHFVGFTIIENEYDNVVALSALSKMRNQFETGMDNL